VISTRAKWAAVSCVVVVTLALCAQAGAQTETEMDVDELKGAVPPVKELAPFVVKQEGKSYWSFAGTPPMKVKQKECFGMEWGREGEAAALHVILCAFAHAAQAVRAAEFHSRSHAAVFRQGGVKELSAGDKCWTSVGPGAAIIFVRGRVCAKIGVPGLRREQALPLAARFAKRFDASIAAFLRDVEERQLLLLVRPDAGEILAHEPLRVTVSLKNITTGEVQVSAAFIPTLQIHCRAEDGPAVTVPGSQAGKSVTGNRKLHPRQEIVLAEMLFLRPGRGGPDFVFAKPGKYRVKASISIGSKKSLRSAAAEVHVKPPAPDHLRAAELLTTRKLAPFAHGYTSNADAARLAEEFVAKQPHSLYADHVRYQLGIYFKHVRAARGGDPAAPKKAVRHFKAVSPRIGAMRTRALLHMAELALSSAEARGELKVGELLRELEGYRWAAKKIGQEKKWRDLCGKLKALAENTDKG